MIQAVVEPLPEGEAQVNTSATPLLSAGSLPAGSAMGMPSRRARTIGALAGATLFIGTVLPDPIRKLFPQYRDSALIMVDATLVVVCLLACLSSRAGRQRSINPLFAYCTVALGVWAVTNLFLVETSSKYQLAAIHSYMLFAPLGFLLPRIFKHVSREAEERLCRIIMIAGIAIAMTGFASVLEFGTVFAPINMEVADHSYGYGRIFLASGIFATGERLARILLLPFLVALGSLWIGTGKQRLATSALTICGLGILCTGRRYPIGLALLAVIGVLLFGGRRRSRIVRLAGIVACIIVLGVAFTGPTQYGGFISQGAQEVPDRAQFALTLSEVTLLGQGAGTSSQGVKDGSEYLQVEGGLDRWGVELGSLGIVFGVLWAVAVIASAWHALSGSGRRSPLRVAASLFVMLQLLWYMKVHSTFGDPFSLLQFWACIGVIQTRAPSVWRPDHSGHTARRVASLNGCGA